MAWVTVSFEDCKNYVVGALVNAIDQSALDGAQLDRFTQVQSDVIAQVRMACATNTATILDEDATKIPQSLRPAAAWLICGMMAKGLGYALDEQQIAEYNDAKDLLAQVARGDRTVENADTDDTTPDAQAGSSIELVSASTSLYTATTMCSL
jgi:hypothetical protein